MESRTFKTSPVAEFRPCRLGELLHESHKATVHLYTACPFSTQHWKRPSNTQLNRSPSALAFPANLVFSWSRRRPFAPCLAGISPYCTPYQGMAEQHEKPVASEVQDVSGSSADELGLFDVLPKDDLPWYKKRHLLLLNLAMVVPYLSSTTNGYDGSMLNGLQSMDQWQDFFGKPTGYRLGSLSNGVIFGQILAFPIAPWLCDHTGRRFPIFIGSILLVIGAILQCASQNYAMFIGARLIIGFGGLIAVEASPMLVSELAYPTHRGVLVGYYVSRALDASARPSSADRRCAKEQPMVLGLPCGCFHHVRDLLHGAA